MIMLLKQYRLTILFTLLGALAGYAYWYFIGCQTGTCPLKSVWYYNVIFGSLIGYLVGDSIREAIEKKKAKQATNSAD
jgi:membrane protein DedA with SNARE-associated domain